MMSRVSASLLGSGLIQFVGGLLTSAIALVVLFFISPVLTAVALPILAGLAFAIWRSFAILRPMFRERSVISAEVTGRLAESLAGIRVVKAYGPSRARMPNSPTERSACSTTPCGL